MVCSVPVGTCAQIIARETHQRMSGEDRKIKISFLRDRVSMLLLQSQHSEASKLLEELTSLQSAKELDTLLQTAECDLYLEKDERACEAIDAVRSLIVTSHVLTPEDVFVLGSDLFESKFHVRAIILLRMASDLYKMSSPPDGAANGIYKCLNKTALATEALAKVEGRSRMIGLDFGIKYMNEMYEDLSGLQTCSKPEDESLNREWSLNCIGCCYALVKEFEKSLETLLIGIEMLRSRFGTRDSKYRVRGCTLHNVGAAYFAMGDFPSAQSYFLDAIREKQKAKDYADDNQMKTEILNSTLGLERTLIQLRKI